MNRRRNKSWKKRLFRFTRRTTRRFMVFWDEWGVSTDDLWGLAGAAVLIMGLPFMLTIIGTITIG